MANHRSIRDEVTISLVKPSLKTLTPRRGETWMEHIFPLIGVFGANATGKSALLDALGYTFSAIHASSTTWQSFNSMPRAPFKLDDSSRNKTGLFELDFVFQNRRYLYGFEVADYGIAREWLSDIPSTRWRTLIDRDTAAETFKLHPSIKSLGVIAKRELMLSRALLVEHPVLAPLARNLLGSFDTISVKDTNRARRLEAIADSLVDGSLSFSEIQTILRAADIGVKEVSVQEDDLPAPLREAIRAFNEKLNESDEESDPESGSGAETSSSEDLGDEQSDAVVRSLLFTHEGTAENPPTFDINEESDGTIAWLSLIVPAIDTLVSGGLLCIDEIDSSLHPHLLDVLLGIFNDPEINKNGAQLIFTSHDTYILSPLSETDLQPEQVWFTDKMSDGATVLTSLADFPRHRDANVARRYLNGRYGGTPRLAPTALASLIAAKEG